MRRMVVLGYISIKRVDLKPYNKKDFLEVP